MNQLCDFFFFFGRLLNVQSSVDSIDLVFENLDFDLLHFMKTEPTVTKNPLKIKVGIIILPFSVLCSSDKKIIFFSLRVLFFPPLFLDQDIWEKSLC